MNCWDQQFKSWSINRFFDDLNNCHILFTANMRPNTYPRLFATCYKYQ